MLRGDQLGGIFTKFQGAICCWRSAHICLVSALAHRSLGLQTLVSALVLQGFKGHQDLYWDWDFPFPRYDNKVRLHMAPATRGSGSTRRSSRRTAESGEAKEDEGHSKKSEQAKGNISDERNEDTVEDTAAAEESPLKRRRQTKSTDDKVTSDPTSSSKVKPTSKKAPPHQVLTHKDDIPRLWDPTKPPSGASSTYSRQHTCIVPG